MKANEKRNYALITGATSGFGYEFAKLFARDGYNLVLVARSTEQLSRVSAEILGEYNVQVIPLSYDLFKPEAAKQIYEATIQQGIVVDVLVNDAGQGQHGKFIEYEVERDIDMIQLNISSLVGLTKYFLKDMVARDSGRILQVSSLLAKYPTPLMAVYAATKAFVSSFTEGLINELKGTNVTMTALLPGAADTDFFHKAEAEDTQTYREEDLQAPEKVAKDGYDALMKGESRVISGVKNKIMAGVSAVMPEGALASSMRKQMSPSEKEEGRENITHAPSREERARIQSETGSPTGDYQEHEGHAHEGDKGPL